MFLENDKYIKAELSCDVITHKLKIKWEWIKYINKKLAEAIFTELADKEKTTITIANPKTLTYMIKYKSEVELIPLDKDTSDLEDLLYINSLTEYQKDRVREIWELRKKERKPRNLSNLKIIIEKVKLWET